MLFVDFQVQCCCFEFWQYVVFVEYEWEIFGCVVLECDIVDFVDEVDCYVIVVFCCGVCVVVVVFVGFVVCVEVYVLFVQDVQCVVDFGVVDCCC